MAGAVSAGLISGWGSGVVSGCGDSIMTSGNVGETLGDGSTVICGTGSLPVLRLKYFQKSGFSFWGVAFSGKVVGSGIGVTSG